MARPISATKELNPPPGVKFQSKEYYKWLKKKPVITGADGSQISAGEYQRRKVMAGKVMTGQRSEDVSPQRIITNPLFSAIKVLYREAKMGLVGDGTGEAGRENETYALYEATCKRVAMEVYRQAEMVEKGELAFEKFILEQYSMGMHFDSVEDIERFRQVPIGSTPLDQRLLYYWANPWMFFKDIVGYEVLSKTTQAGRDFNGFYDFQKEYLKSLLDPRVHGLIIKCCRGGGKTWLCALGLVVQEVLIPKVKVTINAGSEEQGRYLYKYFSTIVQETGVIKRLLAREPTYSRTEFRHGGWVSVLTASEKSSRGPRPDIIYFDETCQIPTPLINAALGGTWTSASLKIVMSSTPNYMNHPFHNTWVNADQLGFAKFQWSCHKVPWITKEAIEKARLLYDANTFRIEMEGEFGALVGSVFDHQSLYKAQDPEWYLKECGEDGVTKETAKVGVDWGYANPTAVTVVGLDTNGHLWLLDSYAKSSSGTSITSIDLCRVVVEKVRKWKADQILADNSFKFQNRDLTEVIGLETDEEDIIGVSPIKFQTHKNSMISEVKRRLERGELHVDPKVADNKKVLDQLFAYEYEADTEGKSREKPAKGNDDYVDSLMMAVWGFRQAISNHTPIGISTGDQAVVYGDREVPIGEVPSAWGRGFYGF